MARILKPGIERVYELHNRWLAEVLPSGGSLISSDVLVWTVEHLKALQEHFVENPDVTKGKSFLEKLQGQIGPSSPGAVQLMAELHIVHFLLIWTGAISATKKIRDIETILSWMPSPPGLPDEVRQAMAPGLVHPGQWVLTRRDVQLAWLIGFALAFHAAPDQQQRLVSDPWALREFVEPLQESGAEGARLGLLHLAHPETFEATVSPKHRKLITARFGHLTDHVDDVDRALLDIRRALSDTYRQDFQFYDDPLVLRWLRDDKAWYPFLRWVLRYRAIPEFDEWERDYKLPIADAVGDAIRLLIAGDPGWYDALRSALRRKDNNLTVWRTHDGFLNWAEENRAAAAEALSALWNDEGQPAQRVDDFVNAVPDTVLGAPGERLNIASFLLMGEDPTTYPPLDISVMRDAWKLASWGKEPDEATPGAVYARWLGFLDELLWDSQNKDHLLRDRLDAQAASWAVVRAKDKPPAWSEQEWRELLAFRASEEVDQRVEAQAEEADVDAAEVGLVDHLAAAAEDLHVDRGVLDEIVELLEDKGQVILYGPPGTGKTYLALRLVKAIARDHASRMAMVQFHPASTYEDFIEGLRPQVTEAGQVTYVRRHGPLMDIAEAARQDPATHVLLIDEINRANLPKVLGELLFLLEYRSESARTLYRPDEPFRLPANLWIIGTMNTADRSVALIDAAMRRRFHFVPFFPHHGPMRGLLRRWLEDRNGRIGVADLLETVNEELRSLVGEHLLIGPSHFMRTDLSEPALERIWTYNVFPLIEEQLWGDEEEIQRWRWDSVIKRHGHALAGQPSEPVEVENDRADSGEPADAPPGPDA